MFYPPFYRPQAAYDKVNRKMLYRAMKEFSIPHKLIRLTKMTISGSNCRIRVQSTLSEPLEHLIVQSRDLTGWLLYNQAFEKVVRDSGLQIKVLNLTSKFESQPTLRVLILLQDQKLFSKERSQPWNLQPRRCT